MFGEHQPVGARDRDVLVLERADDRLEQLAALAHQNKNVAGARGAALDADRLAAVDQLAHGARDPLREFYARARLAHQIERRVPTFDLAARIRLSWLPDFDQPRRRVRQGDVWR